VVLQISWLAVPYSFLGLHLVEDHQIDYLDADDDNHDDEDGQDFAETRVVAWCIAFGEQKRTNDVAYAGTAVGDAVRAGDGDGTRFDLPIVERHDGGFLGGAGCV